MLKIGANHRSGGGRRAGLEGRARRRDNKNRDTIRMRDGVGGDNGRQQLRRRGGGRMAEKRDGRADRTVIVAVLGRLMGRRLPAAIGRCRSLRRAVNVVAVNVAEGDNELKREREQRDAAAQRLVRPEPAHRPKTPVLRTM